MHPNLSQHINKNGHPLCVGFDPDVSQLPKFLTHQKKVMTIESFLIRWYESIISATNAGIHSIKFQSAFFEQFGEPGTEVLRDFMIDAKRRHLFTILDAKRGDISSTMKAYGHAAFDYYDADALTILPWMGVDTLTALFPWLKRGKGVYIVWLSSNASGRKLQTTEIHKTDLQESNVHVGATIAEMVFHAFYNVALEENLIDQIGWVLGATSIPNDILARLPPGPHTFLLPGVGAQGATFDATTAALVKQNPKSLFPISRGLMHAKYDENITSWDDYTRMVKTNWDQYKALWAKVVQVNDPA